MDYARRMAAFRERLAAAGLDAYWLTTDENVRYLCGFTGEDSSLLVTGDRAVLVTDSRYQERAERECRVDSVISRKGAMTVAVGELCKALGVRRVGVTPENVTHAVFLSLAEAAGSVEPVCHKPGIAEGLRLRKDADEAAAVRAALRLAEESFLAVTPLVEPGRAENWLAARLEFEMRTRGAQKASFDVICAAGPRASMPHAAASAAPVAPGDPVLFDWGARLDGYCSDLTRVVCTGTIRSDLSALVDIVLEAQAAVFAVLRPGSRCCDVDAAGRTVIEKASYGEAFGHGIGHGVGLAVHEAPRVGPKDETVLEPGMIVTVEPGVYLPGKAGVRIEEMALITEQGHEILTTLPRQPERLPPLQRCATTSPTNLPAGER